MINTLIDKNLSARPVLNIHRINIDDNDESNGYQKRNNDFIYRLTLWLARIKRQKQQEPVVEVCKHMYTYIEEEEKNEFSLYSIPYLHCFELVD